ncbi:DUF4362 domain-containing protein [Aquibacillus halophilus]|nr:DUF4362 domain-containing protein [Aquibacillus halophilus]
MVTALTACNENTNDGGTIHPVGVEEEKQPDVKEESKPNVPGVKNVDVLNTHGQIQGWEKMAEFYQNMRIGTVSELRIVHYTTEGDPILTDLTYNGESLEVKYDTTQDNFGSGEVITNTCGDLIEETNPTNVSYIAVDCEGLSREILQISYNMSQQDRFEVELKYGKELENEINTLTNTLKQETDTQAESDFDLPDTVKQEVYKKLVFANYLAEKDIKTTCSTKDNRNYYLKVYINGGDREYRWASCDESQDAQNLTEIAEYMIDQSTNIQDEELDITVQGYVLEKKDDMILIGQELNRLDYEWIKDELQHMELEGIGFDFTYLEGISTDEFSLGNKIRATIEGSIKGSNPGKAMVKEIEKLE